MVEKARSKESKKTPGDKPLCKMSINELNLELALREGLRHRYDRDDPSTHKELQLRVNQVKRAIKCIENGKPVEKDDEDDE
ncbi:hypothetical protein C0416_02245 [bacterium]|nr:hypothetical protein [bacterium]